MAKTEWVKTSERLPPDPNTQYLMVSRYAWVEVNEDGISDDEKLEYDIVISNYGLGAYNFPEDFPWWAELPELPDEAIKPKEQKDD
jgi:hypothetical protein